MLLPLTQGILWNMAAIGWKFWNKGAKFSGKSVGAKVRRWWWDVNNWKMPGETEKRIHEETGEFFVDKFGSGLGD